MNLHRFGSIFLVQLRQQRHLFVINLAKIDIHNLPGLAQSQLSQFLRIIVLDKLIFKCLLDMILNVLPQECLQHYVFAPILVIFGQIIDLHREIPHFNISLVEYLRVLLVSYFQ